MKHNIFESSELPEYQGKIQKKEIIHIFLYANEG